MDRLNPVKLLVTDSGVLFHSTRFSHFYISNIVSDERVDPSVERRRSAARAATQCFPFPNRCPARIGCSALLGGSAYRLAGSARTVSGSFEFGCLPQHCQPALGIAHNVIVRGNLDIRAVRHQLLPVELIGE
jgi:hypothetical protein